MRRLGLRYTEPGEPGTRHFLPVAVSVSSATLVTLTAGSTTGTAAAASVAAGHVTLPVTETPTLVLVDGAP